MNDNEFMNNENKGTYRATTNLNTAIESPQINVNSAVELNMKNVDNNFSNSYGTSNYGTSASQTQNVSYSDTNAVYGNSGNANMNTTYVNNSDINTTYVNNSGNQVNYQQSQSFDVNPYGSVASDGAENASDNYVTTLGSENASYQPTMKKKKKGLDLSGMSTELKMVMFIALILVVFLMLMPYVYDFFSDLQLVITD